MKTTWLDAAIVHDQCPFWSPPICQQLSCAMASLWSRYVYYIFFTSQMTCPHPLHPVPQFPHACFLHFHCHFSVVHNTNQTQIDILNRADIVIPTFNKPRCRFHLPVPSLTSSSNRRALLSARGRRSVTPISLYEPPREVLSCG
jgi:hypothetical protein